MGRLTGMETPSFPDNEHDFNAIRLRIEKAVHFIQSVPADMFADSAGRSIELKFRTASGLVDGVAYVTTFMLPTSPSMSRPRTTSCATTRWRSASAISSVRSKRRKATLSSDSLAGRRSRNAVKPARAVEILHGPWRAYATDHPAEDRP